MALYQMVAKEVIRKEEKLKLGRVLSLLVLKSKYQKRWRSLARHMFCSGNHLDTKYIQLEFLTYE